jgi:hypothetical protein
MPYTTSTRREREQAAAAAMDVDEVDEEMFQMIGERLPSTTREDQPAEEPEEPHQEPEELIDEENDPQRLNRNSGHRKRVTQCEFYSALTSIRYFFNVVLAGGPLT